MAEPLTAAERAAMQQSEHDCNCAVCDELVGRYEATAQALEDERDAAREHVKLLEEVARSDKTLNRLQAFNTQLQHANTSLIRARDAAEQRATCLATLEATARAWAEAEDLWMAREAVNAPAAEIEEARLHAGRLQGRLYDAVAALPGE